MHSSYRIKDLATRWATSQKTIQRMIESGQLKTFAVGTGEKRKSIRITVESVEAVERPQVEKPKRPKRKPNFKRWV